MNSKSDFLTLLVAVDGSKHSEEVIDSACDLAKTLSAKIATLFVSPYKQMDKDYKETIGVDDSLQYFVLSHDKSTKVESRIGID